MFERLHFFVAYVGSAALVAFLAACMTSPRVATFSCAGSEAGAGDSCVLVGTTEEVGGLNAAELENAPAAGPKLEELGTAPTP